MSTAEEMEAGKRALARRQGRSVTEPEKNGADKSQFPIQASNSPVPVDSVANEIDLKAKQSNATKPEAASLAEPVGMAEVSNAPPGSSATSHTMPGHDKDMAIRFLSGLDPNATRFTFQFLSDGASGYAEIFHGTLDEVWIKVQALNTSQRGNGVFVTINETDFGGRSSKNILRARALFVDADSVEQMERCIKEFAACGANPSMAVKSGRGAHFYFCTDVPRDRFAGLQKSLIDRVGTDAAIKDLPRVMRLPGTLHLKNPTKPRLVKLLNPANKPVRRWQLSDLVAKLELSPANPTLAQGHGNPVDLKPATYDLGNFGQADRERLTKLVGLPVESLAKGLEANIDEIRSAVSAIPAAAISTEPDWMKLARALAHEAAVFKNQTEQLWEIVDTASRNAPGYNEIENRDRFLRYIEEASNSDDPITIATVFHLAREHGWQGWSPSMTPTASGPMVWSAVELKVSFSKIPHRHWLYGTYLIRGEVTVLAAPGGAGKTALATGMAVEIATGTEILGEKIFGSDLKTLFINGEDGSTEIERRIWAFCMAHANKIPVQSPDRLFVAGANDARVQRLSFLRTTDRNFSMLDPNGFEILESALEALRPDLLILDPLVAFCGGGNMNDNAVMALVIRELKRLATKFDCAVLIIHHTRKGADDGNAEAISGASATVNLARRALMPVSMTDKESRAVTTCYRRIGFDISSWWMPSQTSHLARLTVPGIGCIVLSFPTLSPRSTPTAIMYRQSNG